MSHYLPQCVYAFFDAPSVIRHQPTRHAIRKHRQYDPLAPIIDRLVPIPPPTTPSLNEQKQLEVAQRQELHAETIALERAAYDRNSAPLEPDTELTEDPELTLFIGRLDYKVDATILEEEMKRYGTIISCRVVHDPLADVGIDMGSDQPQQKSLGYGFVQYSSKSECEAAYRGADGAKILDKAIVVDWERRRTDPSWFPRRLHGGEGTTRHRDKTQVVTHPGRTRDYIIFRENRRRQEELKAIEERERAQEERRGGRGGFRGGGGFGGGGGGRWNNNNSNNHDNRRNFDRGGYHDRAGDRGRPNDNNRGYDRNDHRDRDRDRNYQGGGARW